MSEKIVKFVDGKMISYTLYDLVDNTDKILSTVTEPFDFMSPPTEPTELAISLTQTMNKHGGIGLAANQVGLPFRVFVMGLHGSYYACFNPEIVSTFGQVGAEEGCLSYPGLFLKVQRADRVTMKYQDASGTFKEETFTGLTAKIIQHEIDHLNGKLWTDSVPRVSLMRAKEKVKINKKRAQRARVI